MLGHALPIMAALQMREERRGFLPPVVQSVNVRDWHLGKFFLSDALQASHVDAVHFPDWCLIADTEGTDAAVLTEEVLVLLRVEKVLDHLVLARQQAKALGLGNRYPEAVSAADGAIAPVGACRQIEISLEPNRSAVATPAVGLQHDWTLA